MKNQEANAFDPGNLLKNSLTKMTQTQKLSFLSRLTSSIPRKRYRESRSPTASSKGASGSGGGGGGGDAQAPRKPKKRKSGAAGGFVVVSILFFPSQIFARAYNDERKVARRKVRKSVLGFANRLATNVRRNAKVGWKV